MSSTMPYGVSNSFKRGTLRTYSRQPRRVRDDEDVHPRKKICMDERGFVKTDLVALTRPQTADPPSSVPTSPHHKSVVFSEDTTHESDSSLSPPSSPPPQLLSPPKKTHPPTFKFLKRKRSKLSDKEPSSDPLQETCDNVHKLKRAVKKARLTQLQIDLGGEVRRECKECGMDYIPSNPEDAALHKEFHSTNVGGVDMGRGFSKDPAAPVVGLYGEGEQISVVDGKCALGIRNKVKKVLAFVNHELGAVEIEDDALWGNMPSTKAGEKKRALRAGKEEEQEGRFKVFLYLAGDKCIGLCLAERIRHASKVIDTENAQGSTATDNTKLKSSSITTDSEEHLALLGISRIWTSSKHRRKGIASALLDCARHHFFYGIEVPKNMVAFSQPTESGGHLAGAWFSGSESWHVYGDS